MTANPTGAPARRRRWLVPLIIVLGVAFVIGATAYLFRDELRDEWELRQFRRAAASDDPDLPRHRDRLRERLNRSEESLDLAVRLADDPDPKVRAAAVELLVANQPRAKRRDAEAGLVAGARFSVWRSKVSEAVSRLLNDRDENVRMTAQRAVSELECAEDFRAELDGVMRKRPPAERAIVAAGLAHWNGTLLCEVIADRDQPDEARVAAMRGIDAWGDAAVAVRREELQKALRSALQSPRAEVRQAATRALRYAGRAPAAWLDILTDDRQKELHPLALQTWLDALGEPPSARHWIETHDAWFHSSNDARRCAVATHVLCEGAKLQMHHLRHSPPIAEAAAMQDRQGPAGRAFDRQLARLGNILSVLSAVRWYCDTIEKPPELVGWLPHETPNGAPPKRELKAYLFQQVKPIWEWGLSHKAEYPTRFLTTDNIVKHYGRAEVPRPVPLRPLGAVMDELLVGQAAFDKLRAQYDGK